MPVLSVDALDPTDANAQVQVLDLHRRAETADGVAALSEQSRLALQGKGSQHRHLLARLDGVLAGYLSAEPGAAPSAELVVEPALRRRGTGRALWNALVGDLGPADAPPKVWAHGNLEPARGFAAALDLRPVRELYRMSRPLGPEDAVEVELPVGYTARAFVPGRDDKAVVATNAAAFADHPEQGRMGLAGLHTRMAQSWFDPQGLIVVEAEEVPGAVAAFHWTKVDPPASAVGEVYVVGVDPAHQGRGLARPLTALGLAHLARRGLSEVELYVDGDNAPARQTYARLGFTPMMVDVMYSPSVHVEVRA